MAQNPNPPQPGRLEEEPDSALLKIRLCLFVISLPIILWTYLLLGYQRERQYDCESLLDSLVGQWTAIFLLTMFLLIFHLWVSIIYIDDNKIASYYVYQTKSSIIWLQLLLVVGFIGIWCFVPFMGEKSLFGVFGSSSSQPQLLVQSGNHNGSLYWDTNVKSCLCTTPAREKSVYWAYMYREAYFGVYDEIFGKGNKDDLQILDERPRYHEVCYSTKLRNNGERKSCYNCCGCEEHFLKTLQEKLWGMGNAQYVQTFLLMVANGVAVVDELLTHVRRRIS